MNSFSERKSGTRSHHLIIFSHYLMRKNKQLWKKSILNKSDYQVTLMHTSWNNGSDLCTHRTISSTASMLSSRFYFSVYTPMRSVYDPFSSKALPVLLQTRAVFSKYRMLLYVMLTESLWLLSLKIDTATYFLDKNSGCRKLAETCIVSYLQIEPNKNFEVVSTPELLQK